jgi:hypothetical protein
MHNMQARRRATALFFTASRQHDLDRVRRPAASDLGQGYPSSAQAPDAAEAETGDGAAPAPRRGPAENEAWGRARLVASPLGDGLGLIMAQATWVGGRSAAARLGLPDRLRDAMDMPREEFP